MTGSIGAAYSATGAAWQHGPGRIYDRLAAVLVDRLPAVERGPVLDLGAGTGAASRALMARGQAVVACDVSFGMLATGRSQRPPAVVGDALALPFPDAAFPGIVAAFSLNHLTAPVAGLREAARVLAPGGTVVVSAYALDDSHPVKEATERAATEASWTPPPWYTEVRTEAMPLLATTERAEAAAASAGLAGVAEALHVEFPELGPRDLVEWRLGMAQYAPFVASLPPAQQTRLRDRALELLGSGPPLVRSIVVLTARAP